MIVFASGAGNDFELETDRSAAQSPENYIYTYKNPPDSHVCIYLLLVLVGEGEQGGDVEHELVLLVGGVHAVDRSLKIFIAVI